MTFETFLREKHAKEYIGTDDKMADAFDEWLEDKQADHFIKYAEEWHRQELEETQNKIKGYPRADM